MFGGTHTAIVYIQCRLKFQPLDKLTSPCEKTEISSKPVLFV